MSNNPFLQPENFFEGYQEQIDEMRKNPNFIEMDKLCYEVFGRTEDGRKLLKLLEERFVLPGTPASLANPNYSLTCVYFEGYRDAYRQLIHAVKSYEARKNAEMNKALSEEN